MPVRAELIRPDVPQTSVRAELVEALPFPLHWKEKQPFDKLRANGVGFP